MVQMVSFADAIKSISYPGLKGFDKKGNAIFSQIKVKNPSPKVVEDALTESVRHDYTKMGGLSTVINDLPITSWGRPEKQKSFEELMKECNTMVAKSKNTMANIGTVSKDYGKI